MNHRNAIAILLLLPWFAVAEDVYSPLRVITVHKITTEHHLHDTRPADGTNTSGLQVNPAHQVYHYFPGAQIHGQTVELVDMEARTVTMSDGDKKTITVMPKETAIRTNIGVVSLSTGEIYWGVPGATLSNQLTIIEVNSDGGIIAEFPNIGRGIIPKVTVPELQAIGKQKSQQGVPECLLRGK